VTVVIVVVIAVVVVVVVGALLLGVGGRGRRSVDDIDSFRRQIDALSPEARRQTSDRMKPSERTSRGDDGGDDQ
jgi:hypothetical protein